jgi:hypothetical protein
MSGPLKKSMYDVMKHIPLDRVFQCRDLPLLKDGRRILGADLRKLADNGFLRRYPVDAESRRTWEATESLRRRRKA